MESLVAIIDLMYRNTVIDYIEVLKDYHILCKNNHFQ
jgi:hypothetical protein